MTLMHLVKCERKERCLSAEKIRHGWRSEWRASGLHPGRPLAAYIASAVVAHGDDPQVFVGERDTRTYTLGELYERAVSVGNAIADAGIGAGDVVAVHLANVPEAIIAYMAVYAAGACLVPIPSIYSSRETGFILADSGAKMLITADQWRGHTYLDAVPGYLADGPLRHVIVVGDSPHDYRSFRSLLEAPSSSLPVPEQVSGEDAAAIVYTSGSTANPKGAIHSDDSLAFEARQVYPPERMEGSVWLNAVPAGHMGGFLAVLKLMMFGRPGVWLERWDPSAALQVIRGQDINTATLVPYHLMTLLEAMDREGVRQLGLRDVRCGSTTVPTTLIEKAAAHGLGAYRCYGSTEHPTISTCDMQGTLAYRSETDGRVFPKVTVRVVADDGRDVPAGAEGEILSRGPDQFLRYTSEAENLTALTPEGYFRTGDIGYVRDGVITITGRKKEIIIRGGENLSVREIEELLLRHPAVRDAAVVPRAHDRYGEQVWAFLQTAGNEQLTLEDIRAHFRDLGVARQKTPEGVVVLPEFPRTPAGKVAKRELRESLSGVATPR